MRRDLTLPPARTTAFRRHLARGICLVIAAATLAGCVVAPYPGYYRPYPRYYYR